MTCRAARGAVPSLSAYRVILRRGSWATMSRTVLAASRQDALCGAWRGLSASNAVPDGWEVVEAWEIPATGTD